jgi:NarL family two-component system response regulator LiaR
MAGPDHDGEQPAAQGGGDDSSLPADVLLIMAPHVAALGLRTTITRSPDLRLIGEVEAGDGAVRLVAEHQPKHTIVAADGVTKLLVGTLRQVRESCPETKLLICTDRFDPDVMIDLLNLRAEAILAWRELTPVDLRQALTVTSGGKNIFSAAVSQAVAEKAVHSARLLREKVGLTPRETAALQAIVEAGKQDAAAQRLNISVRTLQDILTEVRAKLHADSPAMLGAWAHALGLVDLSR